MADWTQTERRTRQQIAARAGAVPECLPLVDATLPARRGSHGSGRDRTSAHHNNASPLCLLRWRNTKKACSLTRWRANGHNGHVAKAHWLLLSLLLPVPIAAQGSGTLTGTVVAEESTPLAEARIRMAGVGTVSSDKDGRFRLTGVSHGDHVLEVRRLGYREFLQPVTI